MSRTADQAHAITPPLPARIDGASRHRAVLLAVPLVLWLIGPDWFLLGTIAILFFLYRFDIHADRCRRKA
ncbi:MAG: DUF599 family protein [Gammaproteobacteria bacterium]|jgi:uncharacterized membrane protein|nr:DUF599 family protein [Gammaproteobacteria bacterium]